MKGKRYASGGLALPGWQIAIAVMVGAKRKNCCSGLRVELAAAL